MDTALSRSKSSLESNVSFTFWFNVLRTIWPRIKEYSSIPLLHVLALCLKSVTYCSIVSPSCCACERNTYLSYVSLTRGVHYWSSLCITAVQLSRFPSLNGNALNTSIASGPAIVNNTTIFRLSGLLSKWLAPHIHRFHINLCLNRIQLSWNIISFCGLMCSIFN